MKNLVRVSVSALFLFAVLAPAAVRAQNITTVAGGGPVGLTPTSASVGAPAAVRKDSLGNTYILDNNFGIVFRVDHGTGLMSVFAGNGVNGFSGEGALAVNASMSGPSGLCIDSSNNVYVADSDNAIIREIPIATVGPKLAGHIYTVAGVETEVNYTYGGDGHAATSANLHFPDGCSFDSHGNMYIADRGNNAIRVVIGSLATPPANIPTATTVGNIYEFAGAIPSGSNPPAAGYAPNATAALGGKLNGPFDVFVDSHDNVFIADLGNNFPNNPLLPVNNNVIREVPSSTTTTPAFTAFDIYTVAGVQGMVGHTTGVPATTALLDQPIGISVDAAGNLFFADSVNQVIREVPAVAATGMTPGDIYDIAGTAGSRGYSGNGIAVTATLSFPAGTYVDATDSVFIADSNSNAVRQVSSTLPGGYTQQTITTVEGNGRQSFSNATPGTSGQLNVPAGVTVGAAGNLLITEVQNSMVRGIAAPILSGALSTVAGSPEFNGFSNTTPFVVNSPLGTFIDQSGNIYIADTDNCIVRKLTGSTITTIAGVEPTTPDMNNPQNTVPQCGFTAQGGAAVGTKLGLIKTVNSNPVTFGVNSVAVDRDGDVFFSDAGNNVIWEVPSATVGTMVAGNAYIVVGTQSTTGAFGGDGGPANAAQLNNPTGIYFDIYGNLFIADTGNNVIREVPLLNVGTKVAGSIYTVAGDQTAGFAGDGAAAISAKLNAPFTVVVDNAEDLFIADMSNQVIREVAGTTANGKTAGFIYTVVGTHGIAGFAGDGAAASAAQLNSPQGLALDGAGDLLIGDSNNNRVRSVAAIANIAAVPVASYDKTSLTFLPQTQNVPSATQVVTLTNTGGATLTGIAISITGTGSADFGQTTTCTATLASTDSCTITVTFTPSAVAAFTADLSVANNALGNPQLIALSGSGISGAPADVLTPNPLAFPTQVVGATPATMNITLSDATGTAPLTIATGGIVISGANAGDFLQTNNCGTTVAMGASCAIMVTFNPANATPAARTATLTVTSNAANSPQSVIITGTAAPAVTPFALALSASNASQTVTAGQTATYNLQVTGTGGTSTSTASVTVTCALPSSLTKAACTVPSSAVTVTLAAPGKFTATVSTTASTGMLVPETHSERKLQPPTAIQMLPLAVLALLFSIVTLLSWIQNPAGRRRVVRVALSVCLVLMPIAAATLLVGCGGGSSSPPPPPPPVTGTPAGTYTITITATPSGGTALTQSLTLVVQ
jgi:trimeric autotransporter adhesin